MDRGYLGDVGRRTVLRFGTVDPKRPAVAIWPCIHEVWTPHGEDRKLYCEPYITYLRPCNLDDDSDL